MRMLAAIAALLLLAGCGGDSDSDSDSSSPPDIQEVAESIGCEGFEAASDVPELAEEAGECQVNGAPVTLNTFSDEDQQEQYLEADNEGEGPGVTVKGTLWVALTVDEDTAAVIAEDGDGAVMR
jgi:ABC-type glycerol-3-phosphate transport system substrate-binding protein